MWAQAIEGSAHEPLDGIFVHHAPGGTLRVLGVLGVHADRDGFTVVEATGARLAGRARPDSAPFSSRAPRRRGGRPLLHRRRERADRTRLALAGARAPSRRRDHGALSMTTPGPLSHVDKKSAAQVLEQIASFLELKGENPFRVRAFRTASKTIAGLPGELAPALADGTLAATKGIGPATLQIVLEVVTTGRASLLEELRDQVPPGLVDMLQIPGLGVAKIRQIHDTLKVDSVAELEAAALDGSLARLPRFGQKTAENILKGIRFLRQASAWRLSHHAAEEAEVLRAALSQLKGVRQAIVAGDVRRRAEVVRDVVIVLTSEAPPAEIFGRLSELPGVSEFAGQDERRVTLRFAGGSTAQVIVTTPVNLGAVLVQATGSEAHLRLLAAHAAGAGIRAQRRRALARQRVRAHARRGHALRARWDCRWFRRSCARGGTRSRWPPAGRCLACWSGTTCSASSTATRTTATAPIPWSSWRSPAGSTATATSASPTTASRRRTPAASGKTTSSGSGPRSTR